MIDSCANKKDLQALFNQSALKELIQTILEHHYFGTKPVVQSFDKFRKNLRISKQILTEIDKSLISNNIQSIIQFLNHAQLD